MTASKPQEIKQKSIELVSVYIVIIEKPQF